MAKKPTPAKKTDGTAKTRATSTEAAKTLTDGAPIEHFRGERTPENEHTGDAGSLEEETLDPNAPYNHTYGR